MVNKKNIESRELYNDAIRCCANNQFDTALQILDKTTKKYPLFVDAWLKKASIYSINLDNYEDAHSVYEEALRLCSNNSEILKEQAAFYFKFEKYDDALLTYGTLLNVLPTDIDTCINICATFIKLRNYDIATQLLDKILDDYPESGIVLSLKGDISSELGFFEDALELYNTALEYETYSSITSLSILHKKKRVLEKMHRSKEAKNVFEEHCRPLYKMAWNYRRLYELQCNPADRNLLLSALKIYEDVLSINPNSIDAWYEKGNTLCKLNNFKEALTSLDEVLRIEPNNVTTLHKKIEILLKIKDLESTLAIFEKLLEIDPHNVATLKKKSDVLLALNRKSEALDAYNKAHGIDPNDPRTRHTTQKLNTRQNMEAKGRDKSWYMAMKYGKFK